MKIRASMPSHGINPEQAVGKNLIFAERKIGRVVSAKIIGDKMEVMFKIDKRHEKEIKKNIAGK